MRHATGRSAGDMIRVSRATKERLAAIKDRINMRHELGQLDCWWPGSELTFDALINELCRRWEGKKPRRAKSAAKRRRERANGQGGK